VHHLSAKIPNYRLRAAHESHPMFRRTPVVTLRSSIAAFRLKLWDTDSESLVRFPGRVRSGRRYGIPPGGEAAVLGRRQGVASD
jgi:omega-6 fatty acid desaturase (delta-12 desaturase)